MAADGRTLATGQSDTMVLVWDFPAPVRDRPAAPISAGQMETYWADLAGDDGRRAVAAHDRLANVPEQSVALLRERVQPAEAPPAETLRRLVANLDDEQFARRETAMKQLAEFGEVAEAALREALGPQPAPEARRRIEILLSGPHAVQTPESRRHLRAVRVLECIGTLEARHVLQRLAKGLPEARVTRDAKAALERLARRHER
jgi:hypothetical protein